VTHRGWVDLGARVRRERVRRHLTQARFAQVIGLRPRTISSIERAEKDSYDPSTVDAIEIAMGWRAGSIDRVVNGQNPIVESVLADPLADRMRELWPALTDEAKAVVVRLVELLARR
jgi:transcriptional regulator with XRE-family HTH domain